MFPADNRKHYVGNAIDRDSAIDVTVTVNMNTRLKPAQLAFQLRGAKHRIQYSFVFWNEAWHQIDPRQKMREGNNRLVIATFCGAPVVEFAAGGSMLLQRQPHSAGLAGRLVLYNDA